MPMPLIDKQEYIELFNKIHNNKYNYSQSIFRTQKDKFIYICPVHNEIEQTIPLHKKYGCPSCFNTQILKEKEQEFISKAINKFENKFTYDSLNFKSLSEQVNIGCPIHRKF